MTPWTSSVQSVIDRWRRTMESIGPESGIGRPALNIQPMRPPDLPTLGSIASPSWLRQNSFALPGAPVRGRFTGGLDTALWQPTRRSMPYNITGDFLANGGKHSVGHSTSVPGVDNGSGVYAYESMIAKAAKESGVPPEVLAAIMDIETGGRNLVNPNVAGAVGLMQIVPAYWQDTANRFGGDLTDPWTNIRTAAEILKINYNAYGQSWDNAAAAYFGGGGAFNSDGSYSGAKDAYGTSISGYVNRFRENVRAYQGFGSTPAPESPGQVIFPIEGYQGDFNLHWGEHPGAIDMFAPRGAPVRAMRGGTIQHGYSDIGGYWVQITGDDGLQYYYAHMDRPVYYPQNSRIEAGAYLGGVGDTGNAKGTGAHLHLGIGTTIYTGTGPRGGAGDADVIGILRGAYRY